ncbi:putative protein transport Sec1a [Diplonema papillatum]|nr:putative protein transport Sec1a [Diplonema papillatum]
MGNCSCTDEEPPSRMAHTHQQGLAPPVQLGSTYVPQSGKLAPAPVRVRGPLPPFPEVTYLRGRTTTSAPGVFRALQKALLAELLPEDAGGLGVVLIVDEKGLTMLESVVKVVDLTRAGVPLVESLDRVRQPLPQMPAVYLVAPTAENARLINADWDANPDMYASCFVYAADDITETCSFVSILQTSHDLRYALRAVKQTKFTFMCQSQYSYTVNNSLDNDPLHPLERFFGQNSSTMEVSRSSRITAECIVNVLGCLGDRPMIRYQGDSGCAEQVAGDVFRTMNRVLGRGTPEQQKGVLLIVDRSIDVITPFLHQFTYEAMLQDVRPCDVELQVTEKYDTVLSVTQSGDRKTVLDVSNEYWNEIRNDHIDSLRKQIAQSLRETVAKSDASKLHPDLRQKASDLSMAEFGAAVRDMPSFQKKVRNLSLHMELLIALRREMEAQHLVEYALTEQDLVTQETEDSRGNMKKLDRKTAWKHVKDLLKLSVKGQDSYVNDIRIVILFALTQRGLSASEKASINDLLRQKHPSDPPVEQWLSGLARFKVDTEKAETTWYQTLTEKKAPKKKLGVVEDDEIFLLSRAVPALSGVAKALAKGELRTEEFPVFTGGGAPGLFADDSRAQGRSQRPRGSSWGRAEDAEDEAEFVESLDRLHGPRVHIFVIGGVSPAEVRAVAAIRDALKRDIIIGGSTLVTPSQLVQTLPYLPPRRSS